MSITAAGLITSVAPAAHATDQNSVCVVVAQPSDVANMEAQHAGQAQKDTWTRVDNGVVIPRYGIYYPATDPNTSHATPRNETSTNSPTAPVQIGDHFQWKQAGVCANNSRPFSASGTGIGYCGRSTGLGAGTLNGNPYVIRWESAGSQLHLLDVSATGDVNAQANPPGDPRGSCLSGTAITFLVDGAIADRR